MEGSRLGYSWHLLQTPWNEAMRVALLIVLGLVIGIMGTVPVMNALSQRNPLPKAVMVVMDYHMGALGDALKTNRCDAAQTHAHLLRLQSTAADIAPAFGDVEQPFLDDAGHLQSKLAVAVQAAPLDCAALKAAIKPVGEACKSCHQQYR